MLEIFEKLINEHGSSVILRERLELFSDKYSHLEDKNSLLQKRNKELEALLQNATEAIQGLQKIIDSHSENQVTSKLDKVSCQILEILFDANTNISKEDVAMQTGIDASMVSYHFDTLGDLEFISQSTFGRRNHGFVSGHGSYIPATFRITSTGRKYVVETIRA